MLGCFLFNFVFSAANLPVNFVSCHPVLEYEIKYVANFVNFSLPRLTTSKRFVLMRWVNLVRSFLHFSEKGTNQTHIQQSSLDPILLVVTVRRKCVVTLSSFSARYSRVRPSVKPSPRSLSSPTLTQFLLHCTPEPQTNMRGAVHVFFHTPSHPGQNKTQEKHV